MLGEPDTPKWADEEAEHAGLPYNEFDQKNNVDRTSFMGQYEVVDGMPRYVQRKVMLHCAVAMFFLKLWVLRI